MEAAPSCRMAFAPLRKICWCNGVDKELTDSFLQGFRAALQMQAGQRGVKRLAVRDCRRQRRNHRQGGVSFLFEKDFLRHASPLPTRNMNAPIPQRPEQGATRDLQTGLPNRAVLCECAGPLLAHHRRSGRCAALLHVGLTVREVHGDCRDGPLPDTVLAGMAERLAGNLRAEDLAARLGPAEFAILLQDVKDAGAAADIAREAIGRLCAPYASADGEVALAAVIGIAMFPDDGDDIGMLLDRARNAMRAAGRAGSTLRFHALPPASRGGGTAPSVEEQLKTAVGDNAFALYYQPVIDVRTGAVAGVEALLRLRDSPLSPEQFVPVAEATGVITPIGRWLLREAARQHLEWIERGLPPVPIAVNVSAVEFRDRDFADRFAQVLEEHGIDAGALHIEVTETAVMENIGHAAAMLSRLRARGVKILLDDFGTGMSSLAYLVQLPLDKVKIDKSFIAPIAHDAATRTVTAAIIALGNELALDVVAEGVESEHVLRWLRDNGCTQAQGFHLAQPMTGEAFAHWHAARLPAGGAAPIVAMPAWEAGRDPASA